MPPLDASDMDEEIVAIDQEQARTEAEQAYATLNDEQREAADAILKSLKIPIPGECSNSMGEKGSFNFLCF